MKKAGSSLPSQEQSRAAHFQSPAQQQTRGAERPPARDEVAWCPYSLFNQHIRSCDHKIRWHQAATADWRACISTDVTVFSIRTDHLVKPAMFTDPPLPAIVPSQLFSKVNRIAHLTTFMVPSGASLSNSGNESFLIASSTSPSYSCLGGHFLTSSRDATVSIESLPLAVSQLWNVALSYPRPLRASLLAP